MASGNFNPNILENTQYIGLALSVFRVGEWDSLQSWERSRTKGEMADRVGETEVEVRVAIVQACELDTTEQAGT